MTPDVRRLATTPGRFPGARRVFGPRVFGRAATVAFAALTVLAACDSGPSGPGSILARASAPSLGGVLLEVEGRGIRGFSARGTTQVYSAAVPGGGERHRVLLIDPVGGEIGFDIEVEDLGMDGPVIRVIQATRTDNAMISTGSVVVSIER